MSQRIYSRTRSRGPSRLRWGVLSRETGWVAASYVEGRDKVGPMYVAVDLAEKQLRRLKKMKILRISEHESPSLAILNLA